MANNLIRTDTFDNLLEILPSRKELTVISDVAKHGVNLSNRLRVIAQFLEKDAGIEIRDFDELEMRGTLGENAVDLSSVKAKANVGALGDFSVAEGLDTKASGQFSHSEGNKTTASGQGSHAEGVDTVASGINSHSEGLGTTASGKGSHAQGHTTIASGTNSHAEGGETVSKGLNSHAEGDGVVAEGQNSHAEGSATDQNISRRSWLDTFVVLTFDIYWQTYGSARVIDKFKPTVSPTVSVFTTKQYMLDGQFAVYNQVTDIPSISRPKFSSFWVLIVPDPTDPILLCPNENDGWIDGYSEGLGSGSKYKEFTAFETTTEETIPNFNSCS